MRRVLALDAGSRRIKLLLVEQSLRKLRVVRHETVDLQAEGLVSAEELGAHVVATVERWGRPPVALNLPEELATSQLMDLPLAAEAEAVSLINEEVHKLSGVSESAILHDFVRLEPLTPDRLQCWVTLCQGRHLRDQVHRLGLEGEDICEVTTTANALASAWLGGAPAASQEKVILVHAGASHTVAVALLGGRAVFAGHFAMAGDAFTTAITKQLGCSTVAAESLKQSKDLFAGPEALGTLTKAAEGWLKELLRQLQDWFASHKSLGLVLSDFQLIASGGAFRQTGLLSWLNQRSGLHFTPWPMERLLPGLDPWDGSEIALGVALQALNHNPQPISLLPPDQRQAWRERRARQWIEIGSTALLALVALLLALAIWQKGSLIARKTELRDKAVEGWNKVRTNAALTDELLARYETLRPLFERELQTVGALRTLALLQQARSNQTYWYVLLGDPQTYFTHPLPAPPPGTNAPGATNPPAPPSRPTGVAAASTNPPPTRPGFIAELCIAEPGVSARQTLGQVINDLRRESLFGKVDLLSEDLRRPLADPKLLLPDRHFAVALEFADTELTRAATARRRAALGLTNPPAARPGPRFARPPGEIETGPPAPRP